MAEAFAPPASIAVTRTAYDPGRTPAVFQAAHVVLTPFTALPGTTAIVVHLPSLETSTTICARFGVLAVPEIGTIPFTVTPLEGVVRATEEPPPIERGTLVGAGLGGGGAESCTTDGGAAVGVAPGFVMPPMPSAAR